jgi:hypothetical protein
MLHVVVISEVVAENLLTYVAAELLTCLFRLFSVTLRNEGAGPSFAQPYNEPTFLLN